MKIFLKKENKIITFFCWVLFSWKIKDNTINLVCESVIIFLICLMLDAAFEDRRRTWFRSSVCRSKLPCTRWPLLKLHECVWLEMCLWDVDSHFGWIMSFGRTWVMFGLLRPAAQIIENFVFKLKSHRLNQCESWSCISFSVLFFKYLAMPRFILGSCVVFQFWIRTLFEYIYWIGFSGASLR